MKGKILIFITVVIIAVVVGIIVVSSRKEKEVSPLGNDSLSPSKIPTRAEKLNTYEDPSGFQFKYPESITISQNKISDQSIFSSLKLTSKKFPGDILIEVIQTSLKSVDDWLKQEKLSTTSAGIKKITLADLEAVQFEQDETIKTVAIDIGAKLTFTVTYEKDKDYWSKVNNTILKSFEFKLPEATIESTSDSSEGDIIFEGEEIIE